MVEPVHPFGGRDLEVLDAFQGLRGLMNAEPLMDRGHLAWAPWAMTNTAAGPAPRTLDSTVQNRYWLPWSWCATRIALALSARSALRATFHSSSGARDVPTNLAPSQLVELSHDVGCLLAPRDLAGPLLAGELISCDFSPPATGANLTSVRASKRQCSA